EENGMPEAAPVRLEVRSRGNQVQEVREERGWPPLGVRWTALHLAPGELRSAPLAERATTQFEVPDGGTAFTLRVTEDMELAGPMKLCMFVELVDATDAHLFIAVSKIDGAIPDKELPFEGPFGFGCDVVAKGWLRLAHRRVDRLRGEPHRPYHPHDRAEPMRPGEGAGIDGEILPPATRLVRGDPPRPPIPGRGFLKRRQFLRCFPGRL